MTLAQPAQFDYAVTTQLLVVNDDTATLYPSNRIGVIGVPYLVVIHDCVTRVLIPDLNPEQILRFYLNVYTFSFPDIKGDGEVEKNLKGFKLNL